LLTFPDPDRLSRGTSPLPQSSDAEQHRGHHNSHELRGTVHRRLVLLRYTPIAILLLNLHKLLQRIKVRRA
jgi:hypothetical protein